MEGPICEISILDICSTRHCTCLLSEICDANLMPVTADVLWHWSLHCSVFFRLLYKSFYASQHQETVFRMKVENFTITIS